MRKGHLLVEADGGRWVLTIHKKGILSGQSNLTPNPTYADGKYEAKWENF
jgi:hypothetical protein